MDSFDILIAGGGIAGLVAAARLSADGHRIAVVDPAPLDRAPEPAQTDLRTTAFLQPAIATLERAGAWQDLAASAAPLAVMRLVDAGGRERAPRETADFMGSETGNDLFGYNIPNAPARAALLTRLQDVANVTTLGGTSVSGFVPRLDHARIRLSDGRALTARLVIAADGRDSTLCRLAGIRHRRWGYGQKALVFAVRHDRPHEAVSTEIHRTGGPLTFVPMTDAADGSPRSSVVWMMPDVRAAALMQQDDAALSEILQAESMGLIGRLAIEGHRAAWPIISQIATRFTAERLAVIAEAAHVMPPIGAQGLNTSLHDIETLADLVNEASDPGAPDLLGRYQRRIYPRTLLRVTGVDALNRAAMAESQPLRDLRRFGLSMISRLPPLRRAAIAAGMGRI